MSKPEQSRRSFIKLFALGSGFLAVRRCPITAALAQNADSLGDDYTALQPGQFVWYPERAPDGPVAIVVSIPKQLVFVYRNGILIGVSTCSTGMPGHATPTGVFTVLQKAVTHTSSKYDEPMNEMERLTWQGIALHVGDLPGYPDSHGCIHLPEEFATDLYGITKIGTPVILAGSHTEPVAVADPGPILGSSALEEIEHQVGKREFSPTNPDAATSILVSGADKRIYVLEDGTMVAEGAATIQDPSKPLGSNVFIWQGGDAETGSTWQGIGFHAAPVSAETPDPSVLARIDGDPEVMAAIKARLKPGTVLVTTDQPATPDTRSGQGFTVMDGPST